MLLARGRVTAYERKRACPLFLSIACLQHVTFATPAARKQGAILSRKLGFFRQDACSFMVLSLNVEEDLGGSRYNVEGEVADFWAQRPKLHVAEHECRGESARVKVQCRRGSC